MTTSTIQDAWSRGIRNELAFWRQWMATRGGRWPDEFAFRMDPTSRLQPYIADHLDPARAKVSILDAGAGPLTFVGKTLPGRELELVPIDALADDYNRLLDEHGIEPPIRTRPCRSEELTRSFPPARFDVVHCRNSLDHSCDPIRGLREMLAVTRPGGHLILVHWENEGEEADYEGFHQWNFQVEPERNDVLIWNRSTRERMSDVIRGRGEIVGIAPADDGLQVVTIRRSRQPWLRALWRRLRGGA